LVNSSYNFIAEISCFSRLQSLSNLSGAKMGKKRTIGMWMYKNSGGEAIAKKIIRRLKRAKYRSTDPTWIIKFYGSCQLAKQMGHYS